MVLIQLIKVVFYNKIFFSLYIKMGESTDLTYEKNKDLMPNKTKGYYKNNKERLREQARNKYINLSEEEKK